LNAAIIGGVTGILKLTSENSDEINILYAWLGAWDRIIFGYFTFRFAWSLRLKFWTVIFYTVMSMSLFFVSVFGLYYIYISRRDTFNPEASSSFK